MHEQSATDHPRPQLTRARWRDLAGAWGFAYDDAHQGLRQGWQERADVYTRTIEVPFPPESPASGIADPSFHPTVWYRRTFELSPQERGKRLLLHCSAVDYRAQVWVNSHLVATHEGGHTPFSFDITTALRSDAEQVIVILDSPAIAGFCYTQLTDTGQETNGLLTANREPKLDPAAVRQITSRAPQQLSQEM